MYNNQYIYRGKTILSELKNENRASSASHILKPPPTDESGKRSKSTTHVKENCSDDDMLLDGDSKFYDINEPFDWYKIFYLVIYHVN